MSRAPVCHCQGAQRLLDYLRVINLDLYRVIAAHSLDIPYSAVTDMQRMDAKRETLIRAYGGRP